MRQLKKPTLLINRYNLRIEQKRNHLERSKYLVGFN